MSVDTTDPYAAGVTSANFDFDAYLEKLARDPLVATPEGRRLLTRLDPFAFAVIYLTKHITDAQGEVSFSDAHLLWVRDARRMSVKKDDEPPAKHRCAYIAPRSMGKSTWWFLIIPLWLAAHGHAKFIAAFADTGPQAEQHLKTFKHELDTNALLREDYPKLVSPMTRQGQNRAVADNQTMYQAANGFVFTAKGADSGNLGAKVGDQRPDVLICDDLEPGEANYSAYTMQKRLGTLLDVILPLNVYARVVMVGTVTMPDSITHQLVKAGKFGADGWIKTENFKVRHTKAIIDEHDGSRRSVWPSKWPLDWLEAREGTREYLKNYANDPMGADGDYWAPEDFRYEPVGDITHTILSIDPAVTSKNSSDFTAVAKVSYSKPNRKAVVQMAKALRVSPADIRTFVLRMIEEDPSISMVLVETNQGGDLWKSSILHDLPIPVKTVHQTVKKEVRAAATLNLYQRGYVHHTQNLTQLEEQMVAFPRAPHDDLVDAVGSALAYFAGPSAGKGPARVAGSRAYV